LLLLLARSTITLPRSAIGFAAFRRRRFVDGYAAIIKRVLKNAGPAPIRTLQDGRAASS
jgi:hypothetical protein